MRNSRGFTLIELMITITILATLTMMTAQAITQSIKAKAKMQDQIDEVSKMRDAMRLVERDITLAFHFRDVEKELKQLIDKKNQAPPQQTQLQNNIDPTLAPRKDPETHFVGDGESINFVTTNNARTIRNSRQADFIEVGYAIRECRGLGPDSGSSKCLWRRSSPHVDLDVTKGGTEFVVLEHITEFKLRYIGKGKQDWVSDWRTDAQGDGATKGKFPQAVELSITVEKKIKGKGKKYSMQLVIPIHFPNNPEESANAPGNNGNSQIPAFN